MNRFSRRPAMICRGATFWTVVLAALLQLVPNVPSATAAGTTPSHPGAGYVLDWEDPALTLPPPNWNAQYNPGSVRFASTANGEPVRAGQRSVRFELNQKDPERNEGKRAELAATPDEPRGAERWYGFSVYLPPDWKNDWAGEIVTQWHQTDQAWENCTRYCSPPLALGTKDGKWVISQNWQKTVGNTDDWFFSNTKVGASETGRWTDWVFHVKWSTGTDGVLQIWKDGEPVKEEAPCDGPCDDYTYKVGRNDDVGDSIHGNYMKIGIYKFAWKSEETATNKSVMFYDDLHIADARATRQSV